MKGSVIEHDLWLFLGRRAMKVVPSGCALPAKRRVVVTNDADQPGQLIILVLSGPVGEAPPKSLLLPTLVITPLQPDWRLEMRVAVDLEIAKDGALTVGATDLKQDRPLVLHTSPPPAQSEAPWELDGLRPNCLEWEGWLAKRYEWVLGDRFEIMETLATGGFGVIYVVLDRHTSPPKRIHLLKGLREDLASDRVLREKFASELSIWKRLGRHPNIVSLDHVYEHEGRLYGAMDWLVHKEVSYTATTLTAYLRPGLAPNVVTKWALDFCGGMEHARSCGLRAHLDIKPTNLLIDHDRNLLKIADFGFAVVDETAFDHLASSAAIAEDLEAREAFEKRECSVLKGTEGLVCGTPGFMAPEVFEGKIAWERSDIFSFGVVLWQMSMSTPRLPYVLRAARTVRELMASIHSQQRSGVFPPVPGPLSQVVARCLAAEPQARFSGFAELGAAIRATLNDPAVLPGPEKAPMKLLHGMAGLRLDYDRYCGSVESPIGFDEWVQQEWEQYRRTTKTPLRFEMWSKYRESRGWA